MIDLIDRNARELEALFALDIPQPIHQSESKPSEISQNQLEQAAQLINEKTLYSSEGWLYLYHDLVKETKAYHTEFDWKTRKKVTLLLEILQKMPLTDEQKLTIQPVIRHLTLKFKSILE